MWNDAIIFDLAQFLNLQEVTLTFYFFIIVIIVTNI